MRNRGTGRGRGRPRPLASQRGGEADRRLLREGAARNNGGASHLPVLGFTLLLSLATGIAVGAGAAWRLTRTNVSDALKQGLSRTDADNSGTRTRSLLVVAEVALSLMLLIGAGLMIRSLYHLQAVDTGMDPRNVLATVLILPQSRYDTPEKQTQFYDRVLERARALPGVESASLSASMPLDGDTGHWPIAIEGRPAVPVSPAPTSSA